MSIANIFQLNNRANYKEAADRLINSAKGGLCWSPWQQSGALGKPLKLSLKTNKALIPPAFAIGMLGVYGMNEQLDRAGIYQKTRTNDTSGKFNNGTLVGAKFPREYNSRDEIVGRNGQSICFPAGSYVDVAKTAGWNTLTKGVSVDFWVRKVNASGTVRLFTM